MWQNADISERNYTTDDRWGGLAAVRWSPTNAIYVKANYIHTDLSGLPDFGVPYNTFAGAPVTSVSVPRDTYYGFVNRDFQQAQQDIGTLIGQFQINDHLLWTNEFRDERSVLNYIGTIPEQGTGKGGTCNSNGGNFANPNPANWMVCLNPQSRYQVTNVLAHQSFGTLKFDTGPIRNTLIAGAEISREVVSLDSYDGLNSEAIGSGAFASGTVGPVSVLSPPNLLNFGSPLVTGNPNIIPVNTESLFALETANYSDFVILTAGLRFDQYDISASKIGFPTVSASSGMWNYNLGLVVKPIPIASVYIAYGTASEPVGAELEGTSANYGGLNPSSPINQIFSPVEPKRLKSGPSGSFWTAICWRPARCSAPTSVTPANWCRRAFQTPAPSRPARPTMSRASTRRDRQAYRQAEHLRRVCADEQPGRSFRGSQQYRIAARLHRQSIL